MPSPLSFDCAASLSAAVRTMKPLGLTAFFDVAPDVITLGLGEPDFATPQPICEAQAQALAAGHSGYPAAAGLPELRAEIAAYLQRRFGYNYEPEQILITVGGAGAYDCAVRALVNPGERVLIPQPWFSCYEPVIDLAGGEIKPLFTSFEDGFRLNATTLASQLSPRSKLLLLNYPNNPTGATMSPSDFAELAKVIRGSKLFVISDEIYAEQIYDGPHHSILHHEGMAERTLLISGFSKIFAMTGWRLGYAAGPQPLIDAMLQIQQASLLTAPGPAQYAALAGLRCCEPQVEAMRLEYLRRRDYVLDCLDHMGLPCLRAQGAFYLFPSIRHTGLSSQEFAALLLERGRVAVIPGSAFGIAGEGFIRISYAYKQEILVQALDRIATFLSTL